MAALIIMLIMAEPRATDATAWPGCVVVGPLPEPNAPGNFNGDGNVDKLDYAEFMPRMNGPFADPTIAGWHIFDFDFDYDVDLGDFFIFQTLFDPEKD